MSRRKMNGIVEAIHYTSDGRIDLVRIYECLGPAWSDYKLINRQQLLEKLKSGSKIFTGRRQSHLGGVFDTWDKVQLAAGNIVSGDPSSGHDHLSNVPIF
jgi:hypothetical protein